VAAATATYHAGSDYYADHGRKGNHGHGPQNRTVPPGVTLQFLDACQKFKLFFAHVFSPLSLK
jgi:hypothetical protein